MKSGCWLLIVIGFIFIVGLNTTGSSPKVTPQLMGTWDYTSMTALKNGKPFGTVHFQPGQWTVTFNQDATWIMHTPSPPNPQGLHGSYEVHGDKLDMNLANGKPYDKYRFTVEQDGKMLVLTTKEHTITASHE
jgi:hypothetical protein